LPPASGVFVGEAVGATGVLVGVLVGAADVCEGVAVAVGVSVRIGVLLGVFVDPSGPTREMSSNQMSPVGEPSVIRRSVTFVFDPLFHVPLRYCQLPEALVHNCLSPAISAISIQAAPVVFVRQM